MLLQSHLFQIQECNYCVKGKLEQFKPIKQMYPTRAPSSSIKWYK